MRMMMFCVAMLFVSSATAQNLPPLGGPQQNPAPKQAQPMCTKEYTASLEEQIKAHESMLNVGSEKIMLICDGIEKLEKGLETFAVMIGRDKDSFKNEIEGMIGDIAKPLGSPKLDFRLVKHACSQASGDIDRSIRTELGRLKSERLRCGSI